MDGNDRLTLDATLGACFQQMAKSVRFGLKKVFRPLKSLLGSRAFCCLTANVEKHVAPFAVRDAEATKVILRPRLEYDAEGTYSASLSESQELPIFSE